MMAAVAVAWSAWRGGDGVDTASVARGWWCRTEFVGGEHANVSQLAIAVSMVELKC